LTEPSPLHRPAAHGPEDSAPDPYLKRNLVFLTLDGTFFSAGSAFYDSTTVLPAFASTLTDSKAVIGFVASVRTIGWFLPQLVVANFTEGLRYKKRFIVINSLLQRLGILLMALITYLYAGTRPGLALALFLPVFILASLSEGVNGVPWTDAVANTIPADRRGRLFAAQLVLGGLLAFFCGFVVRNILTALPYPMSYVTLFLCTCAGFLLSILSFLGVREKPAVEVRSRTGLGLYLRALPAAWRSVPDFVKAMQARLCLAVIFLSQPFFVVHAGQNLGADVGTVGLFVSAQMIGSLAGSALAGRLSDRRGNRSVIVMAVLASTLAPLTALALTGLYRAGAVGLATALYPLVYVFLGSSFGSGWIGFTNYVIEVTPPANRATFIGLSNTLMAPFAFLSVLGGVMASFLGYEAVFAVSAAFGLMGLGLALRLPDPRYRGRVPRSEEGNIAAAPNN
jgi:MFS family permease